MFLRRHATGACRSLSNRWARRTLPRQIVSANFAGHVVAQASPHRLGSRGSAMAPSCLTTVRSSTSRHCGLPMRRSPWRGRTTPPSPRSRQSSPTSLGGHLPASHRTGAWSWSSRPEIDPCHGPDHSSGCRRGSWPSCGVNSTTCSTVAGSSTRRLDMQRRWYSPGNPMALGGSATTTGASTPSRSPRSNRSRTLTPSWTRRAAPSGSPNLI
mmetsp:Transcript_56569/g.118252  ORF Transcript_56569/g.118252 Transcript_56569/m.118252 type:complete len:212 (-) Transcript_56569:290-925(-)